MTHEEMNFKEMAEKVAEPLSRILAARPPSTETARPWQALRLVSQTARGLSGTQQGRRRFANGACVDPTDDRETSACRCAPAPAAPSWRLTPARPALLLKTARCVNTVDSARRFRSPKIAPARLAPRPKSGRNACLRRWRHHQS